MPDFNSQISTRETFAEESSAALEKAIKVVQAALYSSVVDKVLNSLETDENGLIKFTVGNIRNAGKFSQVWKSHQRQSSKITAWLIRKLIELFNLNTAYIKEVSKVTDGLEARARKKLLFNLGYDIDAKKVIPDSWLSNLAAQADVKQRVANRISTAIQSKMPLSQFRKEFKDDFLDTQKGLGYLSRYYEQKTGDIFFKFDRSTQQVYAEQLKLNWRIYSGTLMEPVKGKTKGTRPFCRARLNNIYSTEEVEKWRNLKFAGRVDPYDPFIDCGSINCRHNWSVISNEMKDTLEKQGRKVNEYNSLPIGQTLEKY
jgi:hypothetical protein